MARSTLTSALVLVVLGSTPALAVVRNVPADHPTIQAAITASSPGDEIVVAPGTYVENLLVAAAQSGITLRSSGGATMTTIDAAGSDQALTLVEGTGTTRIDGFTFTGAATPDPGGAITTYNAIVEMENLVVTGNSASAGGGIYVDGGTITIRNCTFSDNSSPPGSGGGIYLDHAVQGTIEDCEMLRNTAGAYGGALTLWFGAEATVRRVRFESSTAGLDGGALFVTYSRVVAEDNVFMENSARLGGAASFFFGGGRFAHSLVQDNHAQAGGALYVDFTDLTLAGNRFIENAATAGSGGGIYLDHGSDATVVGNLLLRNTSVAYGGGITIWEASNPILRNNTIVHNRGDLAGGGVYAVRSSFPTSRADIVAFNEGGGVVNGDGGAMITLECSDVFGNVGGNFAGMPSPVGSNGNQSADPRFCDPLTDDFRLQISSPCAPALSPPGCGRVGAFEAECGATSIPRRSLGQIKSLYR